MKSLIISVISSVLAAFITCLLIFSGVIDVKKMLPDSVMEGEKAAVEAVMPNMVNLKIDEAQKVAENLGLKLVTEDIFLQNTLPGVVQSQFPLPGFKASAGDAVKVIVSKAEEITMETLSEEDLMAEIELESTIIMPDLTGLNSATAIELLNKSGITNISENQADDDNVDKGKIISFNPPAGSELDETAVVDIVISKGPAIKMVIVPNLFNKTLDAAKSEITKNNLKVGKVTKTTDEDKAFDRIIGQSVQWGEKVKEGTVIDITINAEAEETMGW
jgi:eukaryotic-like serine/threonine-protein kinase